MINFFKFFFKKFQILSFVSPLKVVKSSFLFEYFKLPYILPDSLRISQSKINIRYNITSDVFAMAFIACLCWSYLCRTSFWPPSVVHISVSSYTINCWYSKDRCTLFRYLKAPYRREMEDTNMYQCLHIFFVLIYLDR